ncbi:MAG TPA: Mur ligase family protein [Lentimicrobium sp.]|nr:Mur ligase family protein [Lentimicrobium sp.]
MRVHFIAIGGSAMHNLAIALHHKGYQVTGSDDEIFEPAYSRLKKLGLLPDSIGWFPEKISKDLDAVILGMHAKDDNPELAMAKQQGIKIFSYPEYLYEQSKEKIRIVIGGSHGKTTITAMILHVMKDLGINTDFMVGAQLEGFDVMVKLTKDAKYMVFEGDEYLTSAMDKRPKFHLYKPDIAVISGIAWDHINVFPTFEMYKDQFRIFAELVPDNGTIIYCSDDENVVDIVSNLNTKADKKPYSIPKYNIVNGRTNIELPLETIALKVFGRHNMLNLEAARNVLQLLGVEQVTFYKSISSFSGASKRLELITSNNSMNIYKDFAHSPSKLKATTEAVRAQYPDRKLIACMELHTYSSLNTEFLSEYHDSMRNCDIGIVYYNRHALELKKLPYFEKTTVIEAFGREDLHVFNELEELKAFIEKEMSMNTNLLMMSSGNFDGLDLREFGEQIVKN